MSHMPQKTQHGVLTAQGSGLQLLLVLRALTLAVHMQAQGLTVHCIQVHKKNMDGYACTLCQPQMLQEGQG